MDAVNWWHLPFLGILAGGEGVGGWDVVVPAKLDALGLSQFRFAKHPGAGLNGGI